MARILLVGNFYASYLNEGLFDDKIIIADGHIKQLVDAASSYLRDAELSNSGKRPTTYVFMVVGITDLVKKQLVSGRYLLQPQPHPLTSIEYEMRRATDMYESYNAFPIWTITYPIHLSKYHHSQGWSSWDLSRSNMSLDCEKEQEALFNTYDKVMDLCHAFNSSVNATDFFLTGKVYSSFGKSRDFREEYLMDDGINPVEEIIGLWNAQLEPYIQELRYRMPMRSSSNKLKTGKPFNSRSAVENYGGFPSLVGLGQERPMKKSKVENALMENLGKQSSDVQKELAMGMLKFISEKLGDDVFFSAKDANPGNVPQSTRPQRDDYHSRSNYQSGSQPSSLLPDPTTNMSLDTSGGSNYQALTESSNPAALFNSSAPTIPCINNLVDMRAVNIDSKSRPMVSSVNSTDSLEECSYRPPTSQDTSYQSGVPHVALLPHNPRDAFTQAYNRYAKMSDPMQLFRMDNAGVWKKKQIGEVKYLYKSNHEKKSLLRFQHKFYVERIRQKPAPSSENNNLMLQTRATPLLPSPALSMSASQERCSPQAMKPSFDLPPLDSHSDQVSSQFAFQDVRSPYRPISQMKAVFNTESDLRKVTYNDIKSPISSVLTASTYAAKRFGVKDHSQKKFNSKQKVYPAVDVLNNLPYPVTNRIKSATGGLNRAPKASYVLMAKPALSVGKSHLRVRGMKRQIGQKAESYELAFYNGECPPTVGFLEVEAVLPGRESQDCVMTPLQCDIASFNLQLYHLLNKRVRLLAKLKESKDPSIKEKPTENVAESTQVHDEAPSAKSNEVPHSIGDMIVLSEISNSQSENLNANGELVSDAAMGTSEPSCSAPVSIDESDQVKGSSLSHEQQFEIAKCGPDDMIVSTQNDCHPAKSASGSPASA